MNDIPPPIRRLVEVTGRVRRPATVALVAISVALAALVLAQAALAGAHLDGDPGALDTHARNAELIGFTTLAQVLAAALLALAGGPRWPLVVSLVAFVLTGNQIGWGRERALDAHVPVGVALLGAHTALAVALSTRCRRRRT